MQLIVNADDFGLSLGINRAVERAFKFGILTSSTVMVNMPAAEDAFARAARCPGLGLGLHLNFTTGYPVSQPGLVPTLLENGSFYKNKELTASYRPGEVAAETRAQIMKFICKYGLPSHLDSHHFVHLHPNLAPIIAEVACEFSIPAVRVVRPCDIPMDAAAVDPLGILIRENLDKSTTIFKQAGLKFPEKFFGLQPINISSLTGLLNRRWEGTCEIMSHPGFSDPDLIRRSTMTLQREKDYDCLTDPQVVLLVKAKNVALVPFKALTE